MRCPSPSHWAIPRESDPKSSSSLPATPRGRPLTCWSWAMRAVTPQAELRAIRLAHNAGRAFGLLRPRVAVAGLNPHAGENGMFGREDAAIIAPAVAAARTEGIDASGPWPGDTVFMRARK